MTIRASNGTWRCVGLAVLVVLAVSSRAFAQEHDHDLFVSALPLPHTTIVFGGVSYYYANHTYYRWSVNQKKYAVVAPPPGYESAITGQPAADGALYIYPRNDVSPDQQMNDRYECDSAATAETGYDRTKEDGGVAPDVEPAKRADYFRAEATCLEARGYRVR